jgi:hypothetical protein
MLISEISHTCVDSHPAKADFGMRLPAGEVLWQAKISDGGVFTTKTIKWEYKISDYYAIQGRRFGLRDFLKEGNIMHS